MKVKEIELNTIKKDELGQPMGLIAVDKPVGMTSHDVVDRVRKLLGTRKVGHAGALDPFATGLLLILVGRYTKLSNQLLNADKAYACKVLFGLRTDTQDTEGKVLEVSDIDDDLAKFENGLSRALKTFEGGYSQQVPIFSSVKVQGHKLRELARRADSYELDEKTARFSLKSGKKLSLEIPSREVSLKNIEANNLQEFDSSNLAENLKEQISMHDIRLLSVDLSFDCSKGTYVRTFAKDLGQVLGLPAMLVELVRTRIANFTLAEALDIDDLELKSSKEDEDRTNV